MAPMEGPVAGSVSASTSSSLSASSANSSAATSGSSGGTPSGNAKWKGRVLRRFKLIDLLGQGSMGKVFRAEDVTLRRHVALKVLPTRTREGQRDHKIDQFIREARSAASVEHPNAVTVYEIGESSGVHYIAMELVEGGNLEKMVRASGPLEIEVACTIAAEAAEALAAAHAQGIIHRDVKPSNLLLARNGRCKLADFGLARYDDPEDPHGSRGECVGTPCYIAPELPLGQRATPQSDIYSLGCTLWFLLTGRPPFEARTKHDMMKMHVYAALPEIREFRPDVSPRLAETLGRACAKNPSDRFDSAEQFARVLRTFTIPTATSSSGRLPTLGETSGSMTSWAPDASVSSSTITTGTSSSRITSPQLSSAGLQTSGSTSALQSSPNLSHGTIAGGVAAPPAAPVAAEAPRRWYAPRGPMLWAGVGTVALALLVGVTVWILRAGSTPSPASASPTASAPQRSAPAAVRSGTNVIVNGSLEEGTGDHSATGWVVPGNYREFVSFVTEDGNRFLRITNSNPAGTVFIEQRVKVEPSWTAVTVSSMMRVKDFRPGSGVSDTTPTDARVAMKFVNAAGERVGGWPPVPSVKEDSLWVERTTTADVPPGAEYLHIQLAVMYATGTIDFDDVKLNPQIKSAN